MEPTGTTSATAAWTGLAAEASGASGVVGPEQPESRRPATRTHPRRRREPCMGDAQPSGYLGFGATMPVLGAFVAWRLPFGRSPEASLRSPQGRSSLRSSLLRT